MKLSHAAAGTFTLIASYNCGYNHGSLGQFESDRSNDFGLELDAAIKTIDECLEGYQACANEVITCTDALDRAVEGSSSEYLIEGLRASNANLRTSLETEHLLSSVVLAQWGNCEERADQLSNLATQSSLELDKVMSQLTEAVDLVELQREMIQQQDQTIDAYAEVPACIVKINDFAQLTGSQQRKLGRWLTKINR